MTCKLAWHNGNAKCISQFIWITSTLDKLVEVLDVTETFIMRGDIDDIKDGLIKEVDSVMADMDEIQIRQFIAMMKAAKEVV